MRHDTRPSILDEVDRQILRLYQDQTLRPAHEIGDELGLSAATVQRRLARLRRSGVIVREVAQLSPALLGLDVTVIVHVDVQRETKGHIQAFKEAMRARPEVQQCWYTAGTTDFILVVRTATLADYETFTQNVLMEHDNVVLFTSFVVLGEVKSGLSLPL